MERLNMEIHSFMLMQYHAGQRNNSSVRKLNKPSKMDLIMKKVYLN